MSRLIQTCVVVFALLGPGVVWAHPGHGQPGPTHYVSEPVHVIPFLIALAVITAGIVFGRRLFSGDRVGLRAVAFLRNDDRK